MGKRLSLDAHAKKHPLKPPGNAAWITGIDEFNEVVAAFEAGMSPKQIREWLADPEEGCGYENVTHNKVDGWLLEHVKKKNGKTPAR